MASYATTAEFREYGYQATTAALSDAILSKILERASRVFDIACEVEENHFVAAGGSTARVFYGEGTDYLEIDDYTGNLTVTMPSGYTVPDYVVKDGFLLRTYSDNGSLSSSLRGWAGEFVSPGWPAGVPVTITATWGYSAIPADVVEATLEIAIAIWRGKDESYAKAIALPDGSLSLRDALPPRAKFIADKYAGKKGLVFA